MNAADTAWIMTATALVLFMTLPGLALFYGGLVRSRNVLSVFMHCYGVACQDRPVGRYRRKPVRHPARDPVLRLPDDLCDHHTSADRRCLC